ncbi:MAG TPA: hypothetical protein VH834_18585 [Solirubrobacteraceae bacterium]|jgi:hypothetical protein
MALPLLLAGPIVRRATPQEVWFWFACSQEIVSCTPKVTVYGAQGARDGRLNRADGWYPLERAELRVVRLGRSLWVAMVSARPSAPFPTDRVLGYDLAITCRTGGATTSSTTSAMGLGIAYRPFDLPTFMLAAGRRRIAHGSCRRPGATGQDAFTVFDQWLAARAGDPSERPAALILTGDQIYADDVAFPLFKAVQRLAAEVCGYVERLPRDGKPPVSVDDYALWKRPQLPPIFDKVKLAPDMTRKALTARPWSPIGFTTEDGEAHLLSFPEFGAMYLVTWNPELCRAYRVDDGSEENLRGFADAVVAARRVLANMATYMVFDDHEITDDWNLDWDWEKATKNAMAQRIIANGLAAYWAFQGWGNDPGVFGADFTAAITRHLESSAQSPSVAPVAPTAKAFDEALLKRQWSFVAPTNPPALCVDTRTRRETREGHTILSGRLVWPHLVELRIRHQLKRGAPLLIVLPTPLLNHRSSLWAQAHEYDWPEQRYEGDYEWYGNYPAQRAELIAFLRRDLDPPALIVFSGDVHHGSVIDGMYAHGAGRDAIYDGRGDWAMRVVQVTSSPIKNVNRAYQSHWYLGGTDQGNIGESVISQFENQYATQPDGTVLAMRAEASTLRGPLGRETFIPQNHLCVVDLPAVAGDDVKVLFIGVQDGALATAQTSVSTRNDPSKFTPPWWWRSSIPGLPMFPELAPTG